MKIKKVAKKLEKMGTKGDTVLAHINEDEAAMLKAAGGSGKRNPKTGLLSFSFGDGIMADPGDPNSGGGTYNRDGMQGEGGGSAASSVAYGDWGGAARAPAPAPRSNTDDQDYANLAAFDKSQPSPINGVLAGVLSALGFPAGAYNSIDSAIAGRNQGAGYGATYADGKQFSGPDDGGNVGGLFSGSTNIGNENEHGGALTDNPAPATGAPATPPASPFTFAPVTQQPFVSKWGKPRTRGYFGG